MATGYFGGRLLFAEDVIRYFTHLYNVQWTPGTDGNIWDGPPRKFTKYMGFSACLLSCLLNTRKFTLTPENGPIFDNDYNHLDFLHYLGVIGMDSVRLIAQGHHNIADSNLLGIAIYLGRVIEDGTFEAKGGWHGLEIYARAAKIDLIEKIFQVP